VGASQARHILVRSWTPGHDPLQITWVKNHPKIQAFKKWGHTHEISHQIFFQTCSDSCTANFGSQFLASCQKLEQIRFFTNWQCATSPSVLTTLTGANTKPLCSVGESVKCLQVSFERQPCCVQYIIYVHERLVARHILAHSRCMNRCMFGKKFGAKSHGCDPIFLLKMQKSKRFKMTVQKSPLRPMSVHT